MPMVFSGRAMSSVSRQPSKMAGAVTGSVDSVRISSVPACQKRSWSKVCGSISDSPVVMPSNTAPIATPASVSRTGLMRPPANVPIR